MFTKHKLDAFTKPLSAMPDQPRISATEMKAAFDACPEELRAKHNALCDEAEQLNTRVDGIIDGTFAGAVDEGMLDPALHAKLATKEDIAAESSALQTIMSQKCEIAFGTYVGSDPRGLPNDTVITQPINLGFHPKAVIVWRMETRNPDFSKYATFALFLQNVHSPYGAVTETGFNVVYMQYFHGVNAPFDNYSYLAFR